MRIIYQAKWFLVAAIVLFLAATGAQTVNATSLTWDNGSGDGNWNTTSTNWSSTVTTWNNATPDDAAFGATGAGTVTLAEAITAGTVTFTGGAYTFGASGGSLSFTTLDTTGATSVGFDGVLAGSGTITSAVGGNWYNNNSAFTGTINHSAGTIIIYSANSLGTGTLNLSGGVLKANSTPTLNNTLVVNATGGRLAGQGVNDQLRFSGVVNFNSGGTGVSIGGEINNRSVAFQSGATVAGDASEVTIGRDTTYIRSGVNLTYTGNFRIERTGPGNSVLNLGDGIDLTTNPNHIIFDGGHSDRTRAVQVSDGGTATLNTIAQNETTDGLAQLLTANSSTLIVAGAITGQDLTIAGDGTGTTVFNGANTYSGATRVQAGTLIINGDNSGATGNVLVGNTNGPAVTLGGTGSIGGAVSIFTNATHNIGYNSVGVLTLAANVTYGVGGNVLWELGANSADNRGTDYAGVDVAGNLNFNGENTMSLSFSNAVSTVDWSHGTWGSPQSWLIWNVGGVSSNFSALSLTTNNWSDAQGDLLKTDRPGFYFYLSQDGDDIYLKYRMGASVFVFH